MNVKKTVMSYGLPFFHRAAALLSGCALALWTSAGQTQPLDATPRMALVFGNAAYSAPDRPLKNPVSDARLMARTLKELGFDVILREDADRRGMLQALGNLEDKLRKTKGVGFVFFAGHGVQVHGRNYIVPIGANLVRDTDAQKNAIDVDAVLQSLRDTGAKLNILVLDACRNNPLLATSRNSGSGGNGSAKPGLAPIRPPEGALVAFATEPGRLASDGKETGNGLYTRHLAKWIKEPDLTLEQVFKRTREAVQLESKGDQIPTEYSLLTGADLFLARLPTAQVKNQTSMASSPALPQSSSEVSRKANPLSRSTNNGVAIYVPADPGSARVSLATLGAGYTKQSYQLALDNDDLPVFELLLASGWQVEVWDVARLLDPREMPSGWPSKIMSAIARRPSTTVLREKLCEIDQMNARFNGLIDVLQRGYDSPALGSTQVLFERGSLRAWLEPRQHFYKQLCGEMASVNK